jgi:hypothetical protein
MAKLVIEWKLTDGKARKSDEPEAFFGFTGIRYLFLSYIEPGPR